MFKSNLLSICITATILVVFSPVTHAGMVRGTITYDGAIPKFREIKMDADPICLSKHGGKVLPQTLVLGDNKEMANVFVRIKDGIFDAKFTAPTEPIVMTQEGCMYDPHIIGLMVGQPLKILNPDGTLHNVHALSKVNPEFNLAMPKFRRETTKSFDKAEFMFPIKCDVHPWMSAWVSVMDHPFYSITNKKGEYRILDVPAGLFKVEAWHEKLGTKVETILVSGGGEFEVNFTFSRP